MIINTTNYSIAEIMAMLDRKELNVNSTYQRGSGIWPVGPSSYFIDTILENFPFPKIYLYEYIDRSVRGMRKELVDGQQRIGTIQRYLKNEFAVSGESKHAGLRFDDLDEETQIDFLSYVVSADVIRSATRGDILQMFRRMNAYTLPLNEAEKRHSRFQGKFKWFVNDLADRQNEFFVEFGVFTTREIVRMADAALIADSILAMEEGIISTNPSHLNALYQKYDKEFRLADEYRERINGVFNIIIENFPNLRKTHMMKPYALHSLITAINFNQFGNSDITEKLGAASRGIFSTEVDKSRETLLALAQAHEAKEIEGPYSKYVWGADRSTDRKIRRTARVTSILLALGVEIPEQEDAGNA